MDSVNGETGRFGKDAQAIAARELQGRPLVGMPFLQGGVDRMFEEMQLAGLPDPAYRQGPASVAVGFLMDPLGARMLRLLPAGSERLVEYMLVHNRITTAEAAEVLGVAVNTARRYLMVLADAGYLSAVRKSNRDPHGYWAVAERGS